MATENEYTAPQGNKQEGTEKEFYGRKFMEFLGWERTTRDVIDFKRIYVDMAGDILAGLALSEIVYWLLPAKDGSSKLRVERDGKWWIACEREEWWTRCRMTPRQVDRVMNILVKRGLIEKRSMLFAGKRVLHIHLNEQTFVMLWESLILDPVIDVKFTRVRRTKTVSENVDHQIVIPESLESDAITETTTTTTEKENTLVASDEPPRVIEDSSTNYHDLRATINEHLYRSSGRNDLTASIASWLRGGKKQVAVSRGKASFTVDVAECLPPATVKESREFCQDWVITKKMSGFEDADKFVRAFLDWRAKRSPSSTNPLAGMKVLN